MAQQAKKMARNHATVKPVAEETLQIVRETEEKAMKMGRDGIEEMLREADNFSRMARECMGVCTGTLSASVESGRAASQALREVNGKLMENVNRAFSENAELIKEAFACRTMGDMAKWHEHAMQRTMDRYFDELNAMWDLLFDGCGKAFEPLQEQSANASHQIRKAMAA